MSEALLFILSLLIGWLLDLLLGDPAWLPHPVVGFGKMISFGEKRLNKGSHRMLKGALMAIFLIDKNRTDTDCIKTVRYLFRYDSLWAPCHKGLLKNKYQYCFV